MVGSIGRPAMAAFGRTRLPDNPVNPDSPDNPASSPTPSPQPLTPNPPHSFACSRFPSRLRWNHREGSGTSVERTEIPSIQVLIDLSEEEWHGGRSQAIGDAGA